MHKSVLVLIGILCAIAGATGGFFLYQGIHFDKKPPVQVAQAIPMQRQDFTLPDLQGNLRTAKEWEGKVMIINFWATWCAPCRREMPALAELYKTYKHKGLTIIGIALDTPSNVQNFVNDIKINYPILIAENEGISLAKAYGNQFGVLPYSVVIDRSRNIVQRHAGELIYNEVEVLIKPLL